MEKIFSGVNSEILLHVIHKKEDFSNNRKNLSPEDQYLQASSFIFSKDLEVFPHKHLENNKTAKITQEALIVVSGSIEAVYYDLDNSVLKKVILEEGDCTITFFGGHSFKSLTDNTKVYEIKNGPYYGKDKENLKI